MSSAPREVRGIREDVRASARGTSTSALRLFADTDDNELIQSRLGVVYGVMCLVVSGFYVLAAALIAAVIPGRFWEILLSPSKLMHLFGCFAFAGAWLYCRRRPRPRWQLGVIDVGCSLESSILAAVIMALSPSGLRAEMMGPVGFVLVMCLRAALVPSSPRWTLLVAAVSAVPVPIGSYLYALHDTNWPRELVPVIAAFVLSAGWCAAGTAAAWAISRVFYGLRAEVKTAMRLGQYTLEDKIGEGGMGSVYRARHALLRRPTAIKLLSPDRAGVANVKRFEREVQLTSKLTHPNTIAIYDFGHTHDGVFYYAMEHIDGISLQDLCDEDGPQPPSRVIFILAQVASALAEAHDLGLIHRDVKPANILLSTRGGLPDFAKVLDFGLVKETGAVDPALSTANAIAGTPLYMAPESILAPDTVDARVDLYGLGGVAYFLLTGAAPFEGANLVAICSHHLHTAPEAPSKRTLGAGLPAIPEMLDALVLKCLAKTAGARFASARELAAELRSMQEECPWSDDEARAWWAARSAAARTDLRSEMGKT